MALPVAVKCHWEGFMFDFSAIAEAVEDRAVDEVLLLNIDTGKVEGFFKGIGKNPHEGDPSFLVIPEDLVDEETVMRRYAGSIEDAMLSKKLSSMLDDCGCVRFMDALRMNSLLAPYAVFRHDVVADAVAKWISTATWAK